MLATTDQASKGAWRRPCRRCDGLDRLARSTRDRRQACVARVPTAGEHSEHRRNPLRGGGRAYETEVRLLKPRRRGWDRRALRVGCRVVDRAVPSRQLNPRNRTHRPAGVASALGPGRVKTQSDLVVMPCRRRIFAFACTARDHRPQNYWCVYTAWCFHTARVKTRIRLFERDVSFHQQRTCRRMSLCERCATSCPLPPSRMVDVG